MARLLLQKACQRRYFRWVDRQTRSTAWLTWRWAGTKSRTGRLPRLAAAGRHQSRAERFDAVYLRDAQAYMLISMPTDTSTIFGVFQVIRDPPNYFGVTFTPGLNLGPRPTQCKYGTSTVRHQSAAPDGGYFSLGQS